MSLSSSVSSDPASSYDIMRRCCSLLGNPESSFKTVHVAGTNGKGSVTYKVAAGLQAAGCSVGRFTSPHLFSLYERIAINDTLISQEAWEFWSDWVSDQIGGISKELPLFLLYTLVAFSYFRAEGVSIAVIETGIGGRYDATNLIDPELAIITSIGLDHCELLGDSLEQIAWQKAGIIKRGRPVLLGAQTEPRSIFHRESEEKSAPFFALNGAFNHYDQENSALAARALELLGVPADPVALAVRPPGRLQSFFRGKLLLDAAHNPSGIAALLRVLPAGKKRFLYGAKEGKAWGECLVQLLSHAKALYLIEGPGLVPFSSLSAFCTKNAPQIDHARYTTLADLLEEEECLVACGSFYALSLLPVRSLGRY